MGIPIREPGIIFQKKIRPKNSHPYSHQKPEIFIPKK